MDSGLAPKKARPGMTVERFAPFPKQLEAMRGAIVWSLALAAKAGNVARIICVGLN
jgi:hypothetical protein